MYSGRFEPTCVRCGKLYSYRTWLIVAPECKEMCDPCEREIRAAAGVVGVIGMALAIALRPPQLLNPNIMVKGWRCGMKDCGSNMVSKYSDDSYRCNGCNARYTVGKK